MDNNFKYQGERFADIQMLRYRIPGFEALSLNQKLYIYYLSEATLWGRDITFDQFGKYNLLIRQTLEYGSQTAYTIIMAARSSSQSFRSLSLRILSVRHLEMTQRKYLNKLLLSSSIQTSYQRE